MSMPDLAPQSLQQQILTGSYKPGKMLPGLGDLAESLGTSGVSLRETLSTLEALHFVGSRSGKETLVVSRRRGDKGAGASCPGGIGVPFPLGSGLEPTAPAPAASAANTHTTTRLWAIQGRLEAASITQDLVTAPHADRQFHQPATEFSGNSAFSPVMHDLEQGSSIACGVHFPIRPKSTIRRLSNA